jgi:hypothetical protein
MGHCTKAGATFRSLEVRTEVSDESLVGGTRPWALYHLTGVLAIHITVLVGRNTPCTVAEASLRFTFVSGQHDES